MPADPHDLTVAGINFSGVPAAAPAPAGSVTVGPSGSAYSFRKMFLYVSPSAADETLLEVLAPADGRIYYTDQDHWGGPNAESDLVAGAAMSAIIPRCGATARGFLGGVMTQHSNCITVKVTPSTGVPRTVRLPINSGSC